MSRYLFILCPNYSGSTLLWRLVSTSPHVSALPAEGQFLPELREIMRTKPWDADHPLPWDHIRQVWHRYWDPSKRFALEKSPPNLIRAPQIESHFSPASFIVMVRDPYAHCEGLMRRNGADARTAAEFSLDCLRAQRDNASRLDNAISFTYEQLCDDPRGTAQRILEFLPDLETLDWQAQFKVHAIDGNAARTIHNYNAVKLRELGNQHVRVITEVLSQAPDVLSYWGYKLYEPDLRHRLGHLSNNVRKRMVRLRQSGGALWRRHVRRNSRKA